MKTLTLLLPLTLAVAVIATSGCSSSSSKANISGTAIGAVGAYGSGLAPPRAATAMSPNNYIYSEHSINAGRH